MFRRVAAVLAVPLILAGCSSDSKPRASSSNGSTEATTVSSEGAAPKTIEVTLTDDGCEPRNIAATAGPTTFKVTAEGSVSEFEVLDGT
ncbi:MAG TPA: hypothetical protein VHL53_20095, partial [Acidimicrobiia bacterium]|nr:hypothetical protein [Acidimicrobiia bacterium]